jgi:hypothetical protein
MRFPFLKTLIAVEVMLAFLTVFLYLDTKDDGGFAGLVIIGPILGMAAIGLVAFLIFVLQVFGSTGKEQDSTGKEQDSTGEEQTAKSKIVKLGGLCIFGLPVYLIVSMFTSDQPLLAQFVLVFMMMLGMYILIDDKLDGWRNPYEILLLLFAPLLSLIFAFSFTRTQEFHLVVIGLVVGFGIFGIGVAKVLRRR